MNYSYSNLFGTARTTIKLELRHKITDDIAFAAFTDNGNVFLSKPQARKFDEAYAEPVAIPTDVPPDSPCQSLRLNRKVYENFPYSHGSLVSNPRGVFDQHYFSYGTYGSWLLPVGSVNLIYGLPWKEPEDPACKASPSECIARKKRGGHWITRGVWYLNVGARF